MRYTGYDCLRRCLYALSLVVLLSAQTLLAAGSGTIRGKILDRESKDPLPGAIIVVKNTSLGTTTDVNGNYLLHNVPAGEQTIGISYIGYTPANVQITVQEDQDVKRDVSLVVQAIEGETVVVTAQAQGQMQAINQQLSSNTIVNVVSEAKIQELPDFNAAEAIGRLPGVSTLRSSGEANKIVIRGMAPQYNIVSIDNITLAATGKDDQSVDLTMISPYMLQSIDVYKSLTPDMEANAIGGSVNMQLREAPSGFHSDMQWQSGYTAKNKVYNNYKAMGSASDRFLDENLGVYLLLNAERYDRGADNFNAAYSLRADPAPGQQYGPVYVNSMTLNRHFETRNRYGGNLILDYKLPNGSISMISMLSRLQSDYQDYRTQYDYVNKGLNFTFGSGVSKTDMALGALQGKYDFGFMTTDLSASIAYSRNYNPKIANYQFGQGAGLVSAPIPNNTPPEALLGWTQFNPALDYLQQLGYNTADFKENDQALSANFKVPFSFTTATSGSFKIGGTYKHYDRNNDESSPFAQLRYQGNNLVAAVRALNLPYMSYDNGAQSFTGFPLGNNDHALLTSFLNDKYGNLIWAPQIQPLNSLTDWIIQNQSTNERYYTGQYQTKRNDYAYDEKYYATYAMTELNIGPDLMIVGGVRYEADNSDITAYHVQQQTTWTSERAKPDTAQPKNHFWLPMVQARYNVFDWADVRYAYTQTLARPSYTQIAPFENMDQNGQFVNAGNPDLKAAQAYNHDLMLTIHNNEIGLFSVGGFYKTIYDFSYYTQYQLLKTRTLPGYDIQTDHPGAQAGATLGTFYNNPYKATVKGVEVDLQTRLWYLPAPFDGIVIGLNYTHIKSETSYPLLVAKVVPPVPPSKVPTTILIDSSRTGRLIFQPDDIVNASIGYDYAGFSGRISFLFQGNMMSSVTPRIETDGFTRDYFRMDASFRQKLPWEGLQLYLDINNINQRTDISAQQTIGGSTSEAYYGLTADLGVRFTL